MCVIYGPVLWLKDPGPLLQRHPRIGQDRRKFDVYKFRITPTSRLAFVMRRYGLDETPQVINILLGKMSLVGPRPLSPADDERSLANVRFWIQRSTDRPGLIGLAVVMMPYPSVIPYRRAALRCDLQYVRAQGLRKVGLYLFIVRKTIIQFRHGHDHRPPESN